MAIKVPKKRGPKKGSLSSVAKLLKESKETNKLLGEIKAILDKQWREIAPD